MKSLKKACSPHIDDKLVIEEIVMIISLKWDELIDDNDDNECSTRNVSANAIYSEIEKDKAAIGDISPETWRTTLREKYVNLMKVIDENLPQLRLQIQLELSVKSILNIKDCTLPLAIIVLGVTKLVEDSGH